MPCDGVADTSVSPAGSASVTTTPVAGLGPLLVTVTVNVTVSPTSGAGWSTVLVTPTSALAAPFTIAAAELLLATGSGWSCATTSARLVMAPATVTVASSVSVADCAFSSVPIVHAPVASA